MQCNIFGPTKGKGNRFQYHVFYKQWQIKDKYIVRNSCDCKSKFDFEIYTKPFPELLTANNKKIHKNIFCISLSRV